MSDILFPTSREQLLALKAENPSAMVIAGGTDLLVARRNRAIDPPTIICLERIPGLDQIEITGGEIVVGAMVTHQRLLDNPAIAEYLPVLREGLAVLGSPAIRHMATIGGNICTASPAGDTLAPLYVLEARLELLSRAGTRTIPISDFIAGPGRNCLGPSEVLNAVRVPLSDPVPQIGTYYKVGPRRSLAISICSLAAVIHLAPGGTVEQARLAWGSVGPTVMRFPELEADLLGERLSYSLLRKLGQEVSRRVSPISDIRASAEYRRRLTANLPLRLLGCLQV